VWNSADLYTTSADLLFVIYHKSINNIYCYLNFEIISFQELKSQDNYLILLCVSHKSLWRFSLKPIISESFLNLSSDRLRRIIPTKQISRFQTTDAHSDYQKSFTIIFAPVRIASLGVQLT